MSIMMYKAKKIDDNSEEDTRGSERKVPKNEAFCFQDWPTQFRILRTLEMLCAMQGSYRSRSRDYQRRR